MPLLKNKLVTEPAPLNPLKKLTLKEKLALRKQQIDSGNDKVPMGEPDIASGGEENPKLGTLKKEQEPPDSTDDGLPAAATDQVVSMTSLAWLAVAPPGFGKSEFFSLFPDCIMLCAEAGHKFITGHKLIIDEWDSKKGEQAVDDDGNIHVSFMEAVRRITRSERFKFVIIDTLDALIKKCIDAHVSAANQKHLSDLGDFGKGFDLGQNDPIRKSLNDLISTGRGLGLITHQQINTNNFSKGAKSKKETSLPNGIHKIIFPQMDIVVHGEYGGIREGNQYRDRIFRTVGSEDILAKNRGGFLPSAFISPYDKEERAKQIQSFFEPDSEEREKNVAQAYQEYIEFYGEVE